jgi:hypothetical protein
MKSSIKLILSLLSLSGGTTTAQTLDSALAYFPMTIGNKWQFAYYINSVWPSNLLGFYTLAVTGDSAMPNGKAYRMLRQEPFISYTTPFYPSPSLLRMDSTTAIVYEAFQQGSGGELKWDSLLAIPGDGYPWGVLTIRRDTILGVPTVSRTLSTSPFTAFTLAYKLGPVFFSAIDGEDFTRQSVLVYARIDGHEYGTLVSVNAILQSNLMGFELTQNYPNPFNPSTTIRYGLPNRSNVMLTVYNVLGQQVAALANGNEEAGYHDVRFDASGLASGVYFYRLQAGSFVQSKRLIVLR